jgi:shikimate kinase
MGAKNIYLLGFMGSGKSFVGRQLALALGRQFHDLDDMVEAHTGSSISAFFAQAGEARFREIERQCLLETNGLTSGIIATGGGTPCHFDNMAWMKAQGHTIYIKPSVEVLAERLAHGTAKRPLLHGMDAAKLRAFISQKLAERAVYYEQAALVYEMPTGREPIVAELAELLR